MIGAAAHLFHDGLIALRMAGILMRHTRCFSAVCMGLLERDLEECVLVHRNRMLLEHSVVMRSAGSLCILLRLAPAAAPTCSPRWSAGDSYGRMSLHHTGYFRFQTWPNPPCSCLAAGCTKQHAARLQVTVLLLPEVAPGCPTNEPQFTDLRIQEYVATSRS